MRQLIQIIEEAISSNQLIISEINVYELVFVLKKIEETNEHITNNVNFIKQYVQLSNAIIFQRGIEIMHQLGLYKHSFDCYHLAFAEYYGCEKLITFDKGFKKMRAITAIEIVIL